MYKNSSLFSKTLVIGIIVLFLGVGIQPAIASVQPMKEIINENFKGDLFQTIIDIADNPDVKNLIEQYENNLFKVNIDRSIYRKILFRNPILFFNVLLTKPTKTHEYLNKCYKMGIEITKIIGEDKTLEIIESVEVTDTVFFDELNKIIINDEILSDKLTTFKEMNKESNFQTLILDSPIIYILLILILSVLIISLITLGIINLVTFDLIRPFVILEIILWKIYWEFFHEPDF